VRYVPGVGGGRRRLAILGAWRVAAASVGLAAVAACGVHALGDDGAWVETYSLKVNAVGSMWQ